eukprot:GEMP01002968.1.p1 GENE.GEMP01002968.1~~GEMP01002968.1.p1  ORF type:complete len:183 (+),score=36.16 GEMP01002968.1:364-912(+)
MAAVLGIFKPPNERLSIGVDLGSPKSGLGSPQSRRSAGGRLSLSENRKGLVTWNRFKPFDEDDDATGLCKTVSFLCRHVCEHEWQPWPVIYEKAKRLWRQVPLLEAEAYEAVQVRDDEEERPRFAFTTQNEVRLIRGLLQHERNVKRPHLKEAVEQNLPVYQGGDLIGYVEPSSIQRTGRIW